MAVLPLPQFELPVRQESETFLATLVLSDFLSEKISLPSIRRKNDR